MLITVAKLTLKLWRTYPGTLHILVQLLQALLSSTSPSDATERAQRAARAASAKRLVLMPTRSKK